MAKSRSPKNLRLLLWLGLAICAFVLIGYGASKANQSSSAATPSPQLSTPTVDINQARNTFQSDGELTYNEVIALRRDIVGDPGEIDQFSVTDKYYELQRQFLAREAEFARQLELQRQFLAREAEFARQLEKCRLKESVGWVAGWHREQTEDYREVPGVVRTYVYLYDPYSGFARDASAGAAEMFLIGLSDKQIEGIKYGQKIQFSGDLELKDRHESVTNVKYEMVQNNLDIPTPTAEELRNLRVTLERTMCFGSCPDYTLTITGDGHVTLEGRHYTGVKGTVTATIGTDEITELAQEIKKADFFSLSESYQANFTDLPTYWVTIQMGDSFKRVEDYGAGPRRLEILEDRIDQIVNSKQWIEDTKPGISDNPQAEGTPTP
jgi:hypothetical protein